MFLVIKLNLYIWLALSIGAKWVGFYLRTETESSLQNVFNGKTGWWIMSKRSIIVLMCHRHTLLDPINNVLVVKQLREKHRELNQELHILFIHYAKRLSNVNRWTLWNAYWRGILHHWSYKKYVWWVKICFNINIGKYYLEDTNLGVRQGCSM
jgi:hypothetical protein